ncbi:uncharacterized protein BKA55DRAFT_541064 [Fusarium redolens]|uniref:Uncharacterized protein n=1 Tax=Fusarium redolens TaxID=48865 RepID=A0A9P9GTE9_FUSRE|nr:uncharacterized protein BKA55DRAFT_541064 [Fusarium redolens]KAH7244149.1 hypothetical protein BKA55DRAFT_541064 [Fusarium redolens]
MSLFNIISRAFPPPRPPQAEESSSSRLPSTHTNAAASADVTGTTVAQNPPPSYREVTAPKLWKVDLWFGSDPELLREAIPQMKLDTGWEAHLELSTTDIVGLMREGLHVSQGNVNVQESCLTMRPDPQECQMYCYDRHFTLSGPSWKGNLVVTTLSLPIANNFRVEHLSADQVFRSLACDVSKGENWVYIFLIDKSEDNANYILDDTPLEGLWPWPRKEHIIQGMKQEEEAVQEEIREGEILDLL